MGLKNRAAADPGPIPRQFLPLQVLVIYLIAVLWGCSPGQPQPAAPLKKTAKETLAIIERDTLKTRNFVPVINHETMIVNLGDDALTIDIYSDIPRGKYIKDSPFTAFGRDSLLEEDIFSPFIVPVKSHIILGKPGVKKNGDRVSYYWENVSLPPGEARSAQYENDYGKADDFYFNDGIDIAGLHIKSYQTVEKPGKKETLYHLGISLFLENSSNRDITDMFFRVFIPTSLVLEDHGDLYFLVEPVQIRSSKNMTVTTGGMTDGFGNVTRGIDASVQTRILKAGASFGCALQIKCNKKAKKGEIYPVFSVRGRRERVRLWPASIIMGAPIEGRKKFHCMEYNLVIGAPFLFYMDKDKIAVIRPETINKPGNTVTQVSNMQQNIK
ncbi:MAG: hypothetical protein JSV88_16760 [Candidatus Aminicenantes bacterium]|nr:MAG: hypothetical protein JSV88_16760 [Candidatus Aminicenantes bacterium]